MAHGEQLLALHLAGLGLHARLHGLHAFLLQAATSSSGGDAAGASASYSANGTSGNRKGPGLLFADPEYDRVKKSLDRYFPEHDRASKERGWDKLYVEPKAASLLSEMEAGYETLREVAKFREAVLGQIRRAHTMLLTPPADYPPPPESEPKYWPGLACRAFLDVLVTYAKTQVLVERLGGDVRAFASMYNVAHKCLLARDEESYRVISAYLKIFEEGHASPIASRPDHSPVLKSIANELMELGDKMTDLIAYLLEMFKPWFNPATWSAQTTQACMFPEVPAAPSDATRCAPVVFRERARSWVIWGLLVCPGALCAPRAKTNEGARLESLLRNVLNEVVVEPLVRDLCIKVHAEFFEVLSWFPNAKLHVNAKDRFEEMLTVKPKKLLNDCAVECTNRAALVHRERRVALAQHLLAASYQIQNNPAVLGPKCASVVACLAASRDELLWYFAHKSTDPPKTHSAGGVIGMFTGSDARYVKDDWNDGPRIGVLLSCHMALYEQARTFWWVCERYVFETLQTPQVVQECQKRSLMEHIEALGALPAPSTSVDAAEAIRAESASALFSIKLLELKYETTASPHASSPVAQQALSCSGMGGVGGGFFLPQLFFHCLLLGDAFCGGSAGLNDPLVLKTFASCGSASYFAQAYRDAFEDTLRELPRFCLGFVDALSSLQDVLHPYYPDEYVAVADRAVNLADDLLQRVQQRLTECLDDLVLERSRLDSQVDPIRAADRILMRLKERNKYKTSSSLAEGGMTTSFASGSGNSQGLQVLGTLPGGITITPTSTGIPPATGGGPASSSASFAPQQPQPSPSQQPQQQGQPPNRGTGLNRDDLKPGFESRPRYRDTTLPLATAQRSVRGLCAGLGRKRTNTILVWNFAFVLREFLRETLRDWLRKRLEQACSGGGSNIQRPSVLLEQMYLIFDAVQFGCEHGGFDSTFFIREGWIYETSAKPNTVADMACQWLLKFLDTHVAGGRVVYSDVNEGFVRAADLSQQQQQQQQQSMSSGPDPSSSAFRAEMWLDKVEMGALVAALGRRGCLAIVNHLKAFVGQIATRLTVWLVEDEAAILAFKRVAVAGDAGCIRAARAVKNAEQIVVACRALGGAVKLCTMVAAALADKVAAFNAERVRYAPDPLAEVEVSPMLWSALPHAVSASLCSTSPSANSGSGSSSNSSSAGGELFWKGADYITRLDAHANNAHLVATGVCAILKRSQDVKVLHEREREFLASFAATLLEMKREQASEFKDFPLRGMTLFAEKIVRESSSLQFADMDAYVPFPLIHAAILDRALGRAHGYEPGMEAKEFARRFLESSAAKAMMNEEDNTENDAGGGGR